MTLNNLLDWSYPGIYEIYCRETNRSYFGHSENVLYRLGRHFNYLETQKNHETYELQLDWEKYGRAGFVFRVLDVGPQWAEKKKRVVQEQHYLSAFTQRLYNSYPAVPVSSRKK
jgi:hypothetical protein